MTQKIKITGVVQGSGVSSVRVWVGNATGSSWLGTEHIRRGGDRSARAKVEG